jgi:Type II secretion system (T2SS), protein G
MSFTNEPPRGLHTGQASRAPKWKVLMALVTACVISGTAYVCAWLTYADTGPFFVQQHSTRFHLGYLQLEVERYKKETGKLPATLSDLDTLKDHVPMGENGKPPADSWRRPFQYQVTGDSYDLYSLGRDGQPGGVGLDADLYAGKSDRSAEDPTLWQFTVEPGTAGIQVTCIAAGILSFPICLIGAKNEPWNGTSVINALVRYGITAIFAVVAAVAISFLHIPSGH